MGRLVVAFKELYMSVSNGRHCLPASFLLTAQSNYVCDSNHVWAHGIAAAHQGTGSRSFLNASLTAINPSRKVKISTPAISNRTPSDLRVA